MAFCYECGSEVAPNDIFCPYCGITLQTDAGVSQTEIQPNHEPVSEEKSEMAAPPKSTPEIAETKVEEHKTADSFDQKTGENFDIDFDSAETPKIQTVFANPFAAEKLEEKPEEKIAENIKAELNETEAHVEPEVNPFGWSAPGQSDNLLDVSHVEPQKPFAGEDAEMNLNTGENAKISGEKTVDFAPTEKNEFLHQDFAANEQKTQTVPPPDFENEKDFDKSESVENISDDKIDFSDHQAEMPAAPVNETAAENAVQAATFNASEIETAAAEQTENPVIQEEIFKQTFNEPENESAEETDFNMTIPDAPENTDLSEESINNPEESSKNFNASDNNSNSIKSDNASDLIELELNNETSEAINSNIFSGTNSEIKTGENSAAKTGTNFDIDDFSNTDSEVKFELKNDSQSFVSPISKPVDDFDAQVSDPPASKFDSVRIMENSDFSTPVNDLLSGQNQVKTENENSAENAAEVKRESVDFVQTPSAEMDQNEKKAEGTTSVEPNSTSPVANEGSTDGKKAAKLKPLDEGIVLNNRYEIIRKIGGGGMGAVYLASDNNLGGVLRAVKEMVQSYIEETQQDKAVNDFKRESMILSTLDHPAIPTIYDYFYDDKESRFYLVMKYINGGDLSARLRSTPAGKIDEKTVTEWGIQIADVLDYLHNRPTTVVYRDLKPANVMIDGNTGRVMLIDFGIARSVNKEEKGVTAVGTMGYAPPELFSGNVEPRSDIYSLGSTMFHLLTGADPQSNPLLIFDFQKNPRPRQINSQLSDQMERILMRSVEYNADARFSTAAELRQSLQEHLDNLKANNITFGIKEAPQAVGLQDQPVFCGFCGQRIMATDMFCAFCGAKQPLSQQGVHSEIYSRGQLTAKVIINATNELSATFELDKDLNLIGRRDPMSNIFPELDLSKYDPQTKISRRHALIKVSDNQYMIEDLGSSNGTLLISGSDSIRLLPHQPRALKDGDKIRAGDTILNFYLS